VEVAVIVLVVGGAGYIGSHTAHALRRAGHQAIIYDNLSTGNARLAEGFEFIIGDVADGGKLSRVLRRVDAVMHFAACAYVGESVIEPRKYVENNLRNGMTMLHAVLDSGVRKFIFSSSCAVYGNPTKLPITERTLRLPVNPYGATKLAFEHVLEAYDRAYGLRFVAFRYFNAAGADEACAVGELHTPETHLIPCAFEAILGQRSSMEIFGDDYPTPDGTCVRDYIHVNDLAEAHVLGLDYLRGNVSAELNLGTGSGHSVRQVLSAVERATGYKVPIRIGGRRVGDPAELVADPSLAAAILGWQARRSLDDMVASAWRWSRMNSRKSVSRQLNEIKELVSA
jgi:UDP-glucose-4-epimerase GalE